ncbi:hypothetical protein L6Q21_10000 [Sandaracinobacter sp. RS1-74]|nr:hypothetical protein [Sandaracinobacteroides sayramensis]MCG2841313.1 hypothetical protein [Sandaracinobacteroides sayramensis]
MLSRKPDPDQLTLELGPDDELERLIDARVAERAEVQALHWRFRLIVIESVMMASLVLAAGIALEQPTGIVARGAAIVGLGCFVTGLIMIGLTGAVSRLLARWRRRS